MGFIVTSIILVVVAFIGYLLGKAMSKSTDIDTRTSAPLVKVGIPVVVAVVILIMAAVNGSTQIPYGHVAVTTEFGQLTSQIGDGYTFVAPWANVGAINVQIQSSKLDPMNCFSSETQKVTIYSTLNFRVCADSASSLVERVGFRWYEKLIPPRCNQNVKDETVRYSSVDIAPNREKIRSNVEARLTKELGIYGIEVDAFLIDDIKFDNEFEKAIEDKQIATQNALEEEQRIAVQRHKADQAIERARGVADSTFVVAEGQARANRELSSSLTPNIIQYQMVQNLSDKISVMMVPAGQGMILNPEVFYKK